VGGLPLRVMPKFPLEKMELPRIAFWMLVDVPPMATPVLVLNAMTLPAPAAVPPIVLLLVNAVRMPN
jgi:hypothetical protein